MPDPSYLIPPSIPPHLLSDGAGNSRAARWRGHDQQGGLLGSFAGLPPARHFEDELGARGLLELVTLLDRNDKGTRAADDAIFVVDIEMLNIHGEGIGPLQHDRQ